MRIETKSIAPTVVFYWHDMWIPHSRFLVEELRKWRDVERIVICGPAVRRNAASVFLVERALESNGHGAALELKTKSYRWRETICTLREWKRIIKRQRPDIIVVCDEALSLNVLFAGMINRLYGKGVVLFYGFENIVQKPNWRGFSNKKFVPALRTLLRQVVRTFVIDRMLMPVRRRIVHGGLVSYDECKETVEAYKWKPPMLRQWWPVDTNVFTRDGPRTDFGLQSEFVVGFVGRFVEEKGTLDLVRALALLDETVSLVLIGDGIEREMIQSEALSLGLDARCRVLPPQSSERLAASYRSMDLVVLPSKPTQSWKEQYGRALVEARLCGAAVAGSDVGAIPIVVGDPEMTFPAGDVRAIAETIQRAKSRRREQQLNRTIPTPENFLSAWLQLAAVCRAGGERQ